MSKIKLPERLYYPIPEAAEFLGCSIRDVYHFCATGMLKLSVYLDGISENDVGFMSVDLGGYNHIPDIYGKPFDVVNEFSGIYGVYYKENQLHLLTASRLHGFFSVSPATGVYLEFDNTDDIAIGRVESHGVQNESEVSILFLDYINVPRCFLCILAKDIVNIVQKNLVIIDDAKEHPRTANRKGEIIPALLRMIPEFSDVDVDTEKACKLGDILEATAASKGIELQMPDKNTWSKYLGRK